MTAKVIRILVGTSFTFPSDFGAPWSIDCLGGGGQNPAQGSAGAAWSRLTDGNGVVYNPGDVKSYVVAAPGGDSYFDGASFAAANVGAKGGGTATTGGLASARPNLANTTGFSGGSVGNIGGAGAAGPFGNGGNASTFGGGTGDNGHTPAGTDGAEYTATDTWNGTALTGVGGVLGCGGGASWNPCVGLLPVGKYGAGGQFTAAGGGTDGTQGWIIITYTPAGSGGLTAKATVRVSARVPMVAGVKLNTLTLIKTTGRFGPGLFSAPLAGRSKIAVKSSGGLLYSALLGARTRIAITAQAVAITTTSLFARATIAIKARAGSFASVPLSGATSIMAKAAGGIFFPIFLTARTRIAVMSSFGPGAPVANMLGRATIAVKGRLTRPLASAPLAGTTQIQVKARPGGFAALQNLSGRTRIAVQSVAQINPVANLGGASRITVKGRAAFSSIIANMAGTATIMTAARAGFGPLALLFGRTRIAVQSSALTTYTRFIEARATIMTKARGVSAQVVSLAAQATIRVKSTLDASGVGHIALHAMATIMFKTAPGARFDAHLGARSSIQTKSRGRFAGLVAHMAGTAMIAIKAKTGIAGRVPLRAHAAIRTFAKAGMTPTAALLGRAKAMFTAKGVLRPLLPLTARTAIMFKAKSATVFPTALKGRAKVTTAAKGRPSGTVALSGRSQIQVKSRPGMSARVILTAIFGRTRIAVQARGGMSTRASLAGRATIRTFARALIAAGFAPFMRSPRYVTVAFEGRVVVVKILGVGIVLQWPAKTPDEVADFDVRWNEALCGDTIVSSTWADAPAGIVIQSNSYTAQVTKLWLSGGTVGQNYQFTNTIVTAGGRTLQQDVAIYVEAAAVG